MPLNHSDSEPLCLNIKIFNMDPVFNNSKCKRFPTSKNEVHRRQFLPPAFMIVTVLFCLYIVPFRYDTERFLEIVKTLYFEVNCVYISYTKFKHL